MRWNIFGLVREPDYNDDLAEEGCPDPDDWEGYEGVGIPLLASFIVVICTFVQLRSFSLPLKPSTAIVPP